MPELNNSNICYMKHFLSRTAAEAMVMNPPEPTKEKEKQGFFRSIKKKKKKTQIVRWSFHPVLFLQNVFLLCIKCETI